ncbi:MAG: 50S ribosomal protein L25 [Desulfobulbaceae bacterium]|nr:50S ribosomal protein L25 [Desulfobulbaceae bacterium]
MLKIDMAAQTRKTFGKGAARTIRRAGKTPAVLYGPKTEPVALELNTKDFTKGLLFINRRNAVVSLNVDDGSVTRHVMVKEIQADPIQDTLVHADFLEISLDAEMTLTVPLKFIGKAKGVDLGGDITTPIASVRLAGKPLDIPDFVEVDVTPLGIGASMSCAELVFPAGVKLVSDGTKVCAAVTAPTVAAAAADEPAGKKGKK